MIMNTIGTVDLSDFYYGIKIDSCSHLKFSGKGIPHINYGIRIHDIDGGGLSIEGLSTDIEVEGLEADDAMAIEQTKDWLRAGGTLISKKIWD